MSYDSKTIQFITHNSKLITKKPFPTKHDKNLLLPLLLKQKLAVYPQKVNLPTQCHAKFQYSPKRDEENLIGFRNL